MSEPRYEKALPLDDLATALTVARKLCHVTPPNVIPLANHDGETVMQLAWDHAGDGYVIEHVAPEVAYAGLADAAKRVVTEAAYVALLEAAKRVLRESGNRSCSPGEPAQRHVNGHAFEALRKAVD